jgi:hypothetical protein
VFLPGENLEKRSAVTQGQCATVPICIHYTLATKVVLLSVHMRFIALKHLWQAQLNAKKVKQLQSKLSIYAAISSSCGYSDVRAVVIIHPSQHTTEPPTAEG